jgi:hypothetical protein
MDQARRTQIAREQARWLSGLLRGHHYPYQLVCVGAEAGARGKLERHIRRYLARLFPVTAAIVLWDPAALLVPLARLGMSISTRSAIEIVFSALRPHLRAMRGGRTLEHLLCLERAIALADASRGTRLTEAAIARRLAVPPRVRAEALGVFFVRVAPSLIAWYAPSCTQRPATSRERLIDAAVYKDARTGAVRIAAAAPASKR